MAQHNETGSTGEKLAAAWLTREGYLIKEINWRYKHLEVDIIAWKADTMHFIEVKTRHSTKFGYPEESITKMKMRHLRDAAEQYQHLHPGIRWIQFDVLAILFTEGKVNYWFNKDVYL